MEDHPNTMPVRCWHRRLGARFTFLVWMGSFSIPVRKPYDQSNLGEKGFILAYSSETESVMVGKAWPQTEQEAERDDISTYTQEAERVK